MYIKLVLTPDSPSIVTLAKARAQGFRARCRSYLGPRSATLGPRFRGDDNVR
jgi:hypothetical protein